MSRIYSLGFFLSSGASDGRSMYSWSSFCIRNGTQARPDSIHTTGSFGKRSPIPLITQFDRLTILYQEKPSACAVRKRLQLLKIGSPQFGPEWNDSTRPRSSIARYVLM